MDNDDDNIDYHEKSVSLAANLIENAH